MFDRQTVVGRLQQRSNLIRCTHWLRFTAACNDLWEVEFVEWRQSKGHEQDRLRARGRQLVQFNPKLNPSLSVDV